MNWHTPMNLNLSKHTRRKGNSSLAFSHLPQQPSGLFLTSLYISMYARALYYHSSLFFFYTFSLKIKILFYQKYVYVYQVILKSNGTKSLIIKNSSHLPHLYPETATFHSFNYFFCFLLHIFSLCISFWIFLITVSLGSPLFP